MLLGWAFLALIFASLVRLVQPLLQSFFFSLTAWCFFGFATSFLGGSLLLRVKVCCSSPGRWRTWKLCDTPTRFQVVFLCTVCRCLILLCPLEFLLGHPNVCLHIQRRFALQMRAILCIRLAFCLGVLFAKMFVIESLGI